MPEKENPGESLESKEKLTEYKEMVSEKSRQEALEREEEHKWRHDNSDGVQKAEEEEKGGRRQNEVGQGEAEVMPEKENPGESLESKEKLTEYKEMVSEKSRQEALEREEEHKWRHDNSDRVQKAEEEEKGGRRQNEVGQGEAEVMPEKENPGESLESKEKLTEYKEMVSEKSRQEALEREEEHKWRHDNSDGVQKAKEEEKGGRRQNEVGQGEAEVMPEKENPGESLESKEKLTEYKEMVSEKSRQEALEREEEHKWRHDNSDGVQKAEEEEKGGRRQNEVGQGEAKVMPEKENPGESLESKEKLTEYKEVVSEKSRQEALEREEEHKWRHDNSDGVQKAKEEEKGGRRQNEVGYKEIVSEKSRQEALEREEEHKWRHDNSDGVQKAEEEEKGGRRQNEVGQGEAVVMPEEVNPGESLESKEKLTEYKEMVSEKSRQEALEREEEHKWRHDNSDGVQKAEEEEKGGRRQNEVGQGEAEVMPAKENPGESLESKEKLTEYKEMVSEKSRQEALEREEEHKWRHDNSDGVQKAEEEEKGGRRQNEVGQGEAAVMPEEENPGESLESKEKLTEYKEMVSEKSRQEALEREEEHKWRHDNSDGVQKAEEEEKGGRRQNEVGQGEAEVMPEEENPGESLESKEKLTEYKEIVSEKSRQEALEREEEHKWRHDNSDGVQKAEEEEKGGRRQNEVGQGEAAVMPEEENPGESLESKEKLTEYKEMVSEKSRQEALEREEEHKWRHDNSDGVQKAEEEEKGGRRQNEVGQGEAKVMPAKENPGESLESKEKLTE
ncbi:uncharacterized protein LOC142483284 [Ascaphus truei]|uniref:uncharacterized protein LOC142483284 n=1 Tax=Ascaphus truei TaxID=8439 RepID=UPI003F5A2C02